MWEEWRETEEREKRKGEKWIERAGQIDRDRQRSSDRKSECPHSSFPKF